MAKAIEKNMWAACIDDWNFVYDATSQEMVPAKPKVHIMEVRVLETAKQYQVVRLEHDSTVSKALRYRSTIPKTDTNTLFNTREEAATALCQRVYEQLEKKKQEYERAQLVATIVKLAVYGEV